MRWIWASGLGSEPLADGSAYWQGAARCFDGKEARAHEVPVAIGPAGLNVLAGPAAGRYARGEFALLEQGGDGAHFSLTLEPRGEDGDAERPVLAFDRAPEALEWLRSARLLDRPLFAGMSVGGKLLALAGALALFTAFMYLAGLDWAVDGIVKAIPHKADRALGRTVTRMFDSSLARPEAGPAARALEKSRERVQAMAPASADSISILIVRDTAVKNAFALPGGYIVVYTGMLRMLETQDEWAALLAHEGGHIHLRHGVRALVRSSLVAFGASLMFGDVSGAGALLMDNAGTLMNLGYGRRDEAAADAFALERLRAEGTSTAGMVSLMEKLLKLTELPGWAAFLSSHPATADRVAAARGGPAGRKGAWMTAEEWSALKGL